MTRVALSVVCVATLVVFVFLGAHLDDRQPPQPPTNDSYGLICHPTGICWAGWR